MLSRLERVWSSSASRPELPSKQPAPGRLLHDLTVVEVAAWLMQKMGAARKGVNRMTGISLAKPTGSNRQGLGVHG